MQRAAAAAAVVLLEPAVRSEFDAFVREGAGEGGTHATEEAANALRAPDGRDRRDKRRVPCRLALGQEESRHSRACQVEWVGERDGGAASQPTADRAGPKVTELQRADIILVDVAAAEQHALVRDHPDDVDRVASP